MRVKLRPLYVVLGGLLLTLCLFAGFVLWALSGFDTGPSRTTDTDSGSLATKEERVAFVSRYVAASAPIADASFHIVYHDNSGSLPGPSDWNVSVVLRVNPADRGQWLKGARPGTAEDASGPFFRQTRRAIPSAWGVSSAGEMYYLNGAWLVWHPEGALEHLSMTTSF